MRVVQDEQQALTVALHFLLDHQSPDGAWRSSVYGAFKDGDALTPLVLHTLLAAAQHAEVRSAVRQGAEYLAGLIRADGTINAPYGLNYPAYTAALSVLVLNHPVSRAYENARSTWLSYLKERQLTEALGWHPSDSAYGGWGYAQELPHKPQPGQPAPPLTESNLSATVLALEALRCGGTPADAPALGRVFGFVCRCQNFAADPAQNDPAFDDGGFFFIHHDALRNKAGIAGVDRTGSTRFCSYGSTTADGLRALLASGLMKDDARVRAAHRWLEGNFSAAVHPGKFPPERQAVQAGVYFYYCWSLVRALSLLGVSTLQTPAGSVRWRKTLTQELLRRQRPDGSWINDAVEVREDDPLVATALAAGALAVMQHLPGDR
jgi:hypothetical protein